MLLGIKCSDVTEEPLKPGDLKRAIARVKKEFLFVGITEYYTEVVCLFHRMFGGKVHEHELSNLR